RVLINGNWFFPEEKFALAEALGIDFGALSKTSDLENKRDSAVTGRDVKFRLQIVPLYGYTCALCKLKVLLPNETTIVEAAHIHAYSRSRNDDVSNGIALCRNHHWAFDQGLWTLSPDYRVIVAVGQFDEMGPEHAGLIHFDGKTIDFSWLQPAF